MTIHILIVDDHAVVRQGLRMFLALDPELEVVGEAENGQQALELARSLQPDVVLMDLLMPVMDGIAATRAVRAAQPDTEVIALTSVLEDDKVAEAIRAGAIGYLLKDTEADALCTAIKAAAAGQVQLSPSVAARLLRRPSPEAKTPPTLPLHEPLTEREIEVLRLLAAGESNKDIAAALVITEKTVKAHVSHILNKLGVASRTQAALYAVQSGIANLAQSGRPDGG